MKILISGGFGFIGSYLVKMLKEQHHFVGVLDVSYPDYMADILSVDEILIADIVNEINSSPVNTYDLFIHLAGANDVYSKDARLALEMTTLGTKNVLDFCVRNSIYKFVYFSTLQVYGTDAGLIDENSSIQCGNDYSITHFFAEQYVQMYHHLHPIDYIIVRPGNIYGDFLSKHINRWSLVPNNFCLEAYEKQTITLLSSGKQKKDFISLHDLCNLTIIICNKFKEEQNEIINLVSGRSVSIYDIAQTVQEVYFQITGKQCTINIMSDKPVQGEGPVHKYQKNK